MPTFIPPVNVGEVPNATTADPPWVQVAMGHFWRVDRGRNVYIIDGTTVTEDDPVAVYDAQGNLVADSLQRTTRFFSGAAVHQVNAAEAALLTAAGYTVI